MPTSSPIHVTDTIAAIATPQGSGAIGMVRISGDRALLIGDGIFRASSTALGSCPGHRAVHGTLEDPLTGETLDDVVAIVYRSPRSYTGEDVVEFCCHGGAYLLSRVLKACLDAGARLANPGEFTYRAFLNGKMDLAQAEAVADLIQAQTSASLRAANRLRAGALSDHVSALRSSLLDACAAIEAAIETDEEDMVGAAELIQPDLSRLADKLASLAAQAAVGRALRNGFRLAIVGRPNVGKSTLFNALLRRSRAIVSSVPGTTRDTIEETVEIGGIAVTLIDTAGLRRARGVTETLGVERSQLAVREADGAIVVLSPRARPSGQEANVTDLLGERCLAWVVNKTDTLAASALDRLLDRLRAEHAHQTVVPVSALTGAGIPALEAHLVQRIAGGASDMEDVIVTHERHARAIADAHRAVCEALEALDTHRPLDIVALHAREAADSLAQVIGATLPEDVVSRVFSRFCMGK